MFSSDRFWKRLPVYKVMQVDNRCQPATIPNIFDFALKMDCYIYSKTVVCKLYKARTELELTSQHVADGADMNVRTLINIKKGRNISSLLYAMLYSNGMYNILIRICLLISMHITLLIIMHSKQTYVPIIVQLLQ